MKPVFESTILQIRYVSRSAKSTKIVAGFVSISLAKLIMEFW